MRKFNYISLDFKLYAPWFITLTFYLVGFELYSAAFLQEYFVPTVEFSKLPHWVRITEMLYFVWVLYAMNLPRSFPLVGILALTFLKDYFPDNKTYFVIDCFITSFLMIKLLADNAFHLRSFNPEKVESPYKKDEGKDEDNPVEFP